MGGVNMKKVLVATGVSVTKMNYAINTISNYCRAKHINVEVKGRNIYEINKEMNNPDVIVVLGKNIIETKIPIVIGKAFESKKGVEEVCKEVARYL